MNAICVDDEKLIMEDIASMCEKLPQIRDVECFTRPDKVLEWVRHHKVDLALLDIDMPRMNGIRLAAKIKEEQPETAIIFLTGYSQYALDAFTVHAAGYLLKPISQEMLTREVDYIFSSWQRDRKMSGDHIFVRTFGNFDIFVDGEPVHFKMARCKEILAYLVDRQGTGVSRKEIFSVVWEDRGYDRKMQKQLDVYIRRLRETLKEYGILDIIDMSRGILRIKPDLFCCDAYEFLAGVSEYVNAYRGEYMNNYHWARLTEGRLCWSQDEDQDARGYPDKHK